MKKLLIGLGGLVVLLIAAAFIVPAFVPLDKVKAEVEAQVKAQTGRALTIEGPVSVSLFPSVAVSLSKVSLANAPGGKAPALIALKEAKLSVKLMPLLSGRVEVESFVLDEPVIALETDARGKGNWVFDAPAAAPAPAPAAPTSGGSTPAAPPVSDISLGDVRLVNGTVTFQDRPGAPMQTLSKINLTVTLPSLDKPAKAAGEVTWREQAIAIVLDIKSPRGLAEMGNSDLGLTIASGMVNLALNGTAQGLTPPKMSGDVSLAVPSIRKLAEWTGNPINIAGTGLGPLSIKGKMALNDSDFSFTGADIKIDDWESKGSLSVATGGAKPLIKANLDAGPLDLNVYLPPEKPAGAEGATPAPTAGGSKGWSEEPIDASALKAVNAEFDLSLAGLKVRKITIGKSAVSGSIRNGRLEAELKQLQLYSGNGKGRFGLDGSGSGAGIDINFDLDGIQAEPLLKDAAGFERLSGAGDLKLTLNGRGRSQKEIVNGLGGSGNFIFRDGSIKGIDIAGMIRNLGSALTGGGGETRKTDFSELAASWTIVNGIATNKDLGMKAPLFRIEGAGTANIPQKTLDYRVTPKAVASLEGQGGTDAKGIVVPVNIKGPWDNLSYQPDLAAALTQNADGILQAVKDPSGALGGILGGLTGGSKPAPSGSGTQTPPQEQKPADPVGGALKGIFGR